MVAGTNASVNPRPETSSYSKTTVTRAEGRTGTTKEKKEKKEDAVTEKRSSMGDTGAKTGWDDGRAERVWDPGKGSMGQVRGSGMTLSWGNCREVKTKRYDEKNDIVGNAGAG